MEYGSGGLGHSPVPQCGNSLGWVETCPKEAAGKYMGHDIHHSLLLSVRGIRARWVSSDRRERMV